MNGALRARWLLVGGFKNPFHPSPTDPPPSPEAILVMRTKIYCAHAELWAGNEQRERDADGAEGAREGSAWLPGRGKECTAGLN